MPAPNFGFGSKVWPGVSKLLEECAEASEIAAKLIGTGGQETYWDGVDLRARLTEEVADVIAAASFVAAYCLDSEAVQARALKKLDQFKVWHETGNPPPDQGGKA